jgi:DNA-binding XRE family transcriptional regulator
MLARITKMTVTEAARDLGVSRQCIYDIKKGKYCPSLALVHRACDVWNLKFNFRGLRVGKGTLRPRAPKRSEPMEIGLFDALGALEDRELEVVKAKRVGKAMELVLRIRLTA